MENNNKNYNLKIKQIRAFCVTSEQGSVSLAAINLFRTQSAITRLIRDLEHTLGIPLFERHARGMSLTKMGEVILPRAKLAINELIQIPVLLSKLQPHNNCRSNKTEPTWLFNERRLEVFVALYRFHHILQVTQKLKITQPAISAALKTLEKGAETKLFHRTSKGMIPTPAGHEIAPYISRALNTIRRIPEDISAYQSELKGTVCVGALPLSRAWLLPQAVIKLISRYPDLKVVTNESGFSSLSTELSAGDIDFIIGALRNEENIPNVKNEVLFEEELVLLTRPNHPLSGRAIELKELKHIQWILARSHSPSRFLLSEAFIKMGLEAPEPVVESADLAVVRALLLGSDMVAAVSSHQLDYEVSHGILVPLRVNLIDTRREIGLMTLQGAINSPAAQALIDCIHEVIHEKDKTNDPFH